MLTDAKLVGFVITKDYDRARTFYVEKLGFSFVSLDPYALVVRAGKNTIRIVKNKDFTPLQSTALGWEVEDIKKEAAWLAQQGIPLEDYPFIQDRVLRIWNAPGGARVAWFRDPDGNILSITEQK